MERIGLIFKCVGERIKNKFSIYQNSSKYSPCSQWEKYSKEIASEENQIKVLEYLDTYRFTTRWQTV